MGLRPRIRKAFCLKPRRSETFKLSKEPLFVEKVRDVLYLDPAGRWCRASTRKARCRPSTARSRCWRPGQAERRTRDCKRNGATSPFVAPDVAVGKVIGKRFRRRRSEEFRKFLNCIEANVPSDLDIRIVMDNYATRKTEAAGSPGARAGMSTTPRRSPRGRVERFFGLLTEKRLKRGVRRSTADLERALLYRQRRPETVPLDQVGGSDSTVLPANAGNFPGPDHKCANFGIRTIGSTAGTGRC